MIFNLKLSLAFILHQDFYFYNQSYTLIQMKNSSGSLTDRQKSRMKTLSDIEFRTNGHYSGNSYTEIYQANKNLMCRKYVGSKTQIEKTKEETYEQFKKSNNLIGKIYRKNTESSLYEKRTLSREDSVQKLRMRIDKLEDKQMRLIDAIIRENNLTSKALFNKTLESTQTELNQIKKELKSKVLERKKEKLNEQKNK